MQQRIVFAALFLPAFLALGAGCSGGGGGSGGGSGGGAGGGDGGLTCEPGFQDEDGDGTCNPDCTEVSCNSGACVITAGLAGCVCDPGFTGAACDALDAPAASSVAFWIDAADASTTTANASGYLTTWTDKGVEALGSLVDADDAKKPKLVAGALNGLPVVRFDGTGDYVAWDDFAGLTNRASYTIFMVVSASLEFGVFLSGLDDAMQGGFEVHAASGPDSVHFAHFPAGADTSDVLSSGLGFSQSAAHLLTVQRTTSRMSIWVDGRMRYDAPTTNGTALDMNVNLLAGTGVAADLLGDIAEILIFGTGLDYPARREVEAYLGAKWFGAAPAVDPTAIATVSLWLDASNADSVTTVSGRVTDWANLGHAGGYFSQGAFPDARPAPVEAALNGRAVVRFDGSDYLLSNAFPWESDSYALFAVLVPPATGGARAAFAALSAGEPALALDVRPTSGLVELMHRWPADGAGGDVASVGLGTVGAPVLVEARRSPEWLTILVGDSMTTIASTEADIDAASLDLVLGADSAAPASAFSGDVAEVVLTNSDMSQNEETALIEWLKAKWGL